jgi:thermitase
MDRTLPNSAAALVLLASVLAGLTPASAEVETRHQRVFEDSLQELLTGDPLEVLYEPPMLPYDEAVGCQPSQVTLESIAPVANALDRVQVDGYRLGLAQGEALPGPVQLRLDVGAGRTIAFERLHASPDTVSSHNRVGNVDTWVVDSVEGGLHPVAFTALTRCQVEGTGPDEDIGVAWFQWDSRQRCAGADSVNQAETRGASDGPAPQQVGPFTIQRDRVSRYAIGLHNVPTLGVGADYYGGLVVGVDHDLRFYAVEVRPNVLASFASLVSADSSVRYCDADVGLELHHTPNDPMQAAQDIERINVKDPLPNHAWHPAYGGAAARRVCVVDTGLRDGHEEFPGRVVALRDFTVPSTPPTAVDTHGHGTHVTGIAAAATNNGVGIAGVSQAQIMAARVFDSSGAGSWTWVAQAIRWCADNGGHVINLSLGDTSSGSIAPPTAVADAVTHAWSTGRLVVASAGNDGCSGCVTYPAKYPQVVAVGCTDSADARCAFSNWGPELDLAAPGNAIRSSCHVHNAHYCDLSGTSMSSPHVAGAAALIWSHVPGLSNAQVRDYLYCGAKDLGAAGWDPMFGNGLLDVGKSLQKAIAGSCVDATCTSSLQILNGSTWGPINPSATYTQADLRVLHSGTYHPLSWTFTASDGVYLSVSSPAHDQRHVAAGDSRTRMVHVVVDMPAPCTDLVGDFRMYN